jgi:hypothetical protein
MGPTAETEASTDFKANKKFLAKLAQAQPLP